MTIVQRIKKLAQEQGISVTYLCKKIGLSSRTYFNDIEKHGREIPLDKLTIIAEALHTTVAYLKGETKQKNPTTESDELTEYLEELKNRPEMRMLFSLAKGATKEDVERAAAIIEALRKSENG